LKLHPAKEVGDFVRERANKGHCVRVFDNIRPSAGEETAAVGEFYKPRALFYSATRYFSIAAAAAVEPEEEVWARYRRKNRL